MNNKNYRMKYFNNNWNNNNKKKINYSLKKKKN